MKYAVTQLLAHVDTHKGYSRLVVLQAVVSLRSSVCVSVKKRERQSMSLLNVYVFFSHSLI